MRNEFLTIVSTSKRQNYMAHVHTVACRRSIPDKVIPKTVIKMPL